MISYEDQSRFTCNMASLNTFRLLKDNGYSLPDKPISYFDDSQEVLDYCLNVLFETVEYTDEIERKNEHGSTTVYETRCRFEKSYETIPPEVRELIFQIGKCTSEFHGEIWFEAEPLMEDGKFNGITLVFEEDYSVPDYTCEEQVYLLIEILKILKGENSGCNN